MGKNERNRKRKTKDSKKHAHDKNKTEAISASNTTEIKVDGIEVTKDSQKIVEETRAHYETKLTDEREGRYESTEDIKLEEKSTHGPASFMSEDEIKKKIDAIKQTVALHINSSENLGIQSFRPSSDGTNSILDSYKYLDRRLIAEHQKFFANEARIIRLNEKNIERMWNIFYSSSDQSEPDNTAKSYQVSSVLKALRYTKFPKEGDKIKTIVQVPKSFCNRADDDILEPQNLPDNLRVEKKCKKEGNVSIGNNKEIEKSSPITDPTWKDKTKTIANGKTKTLPLCDPNPGLETFISQQKNDLDENIKKYKHRDSEQILLEGNISSGKEPTTHASKSEFHNKTTDIENYADKRIEVVAPAESDDKPKKMVRNLLKNDKLSFGFENNIMVINAPGIPYDYTLEKNQVITLNFSDKNVRISFTGNQMLVKTPNSEYDISFRKSEPINLTRETRQTDTFL